MSTVSSSLIGTFIVSVPAFSRKSPRNLTTTSIQSQLSNADGFCRRHPQVVEAILDPTTGELREYFDILLNGRPIQQIRGIHTKLKHKDEIAISPPVASSV